MAGISRPRKYHNDRSFRAIRGCFREISGLGGYQFGGNWGSSLEAVNAQSSLRAPSEASLMTRSTEIGIVEG